MNKQQVLQLLSMIFPPYDLPHVLVVGSSALVVYGVLEECRDVDVMVKHPEMLEGLIIVGTVQASDLNGCVKVSFDKLEAFYDRSNSHMFNDAVSTEYDFLLPSPSALFCWYEWLYQQTRSEKHLKHMLLAKELVK